MVQFESPTNQDEQSLNRNNSNAFGRKVSKRILKLYGHNVVDEVDERIGETS